MWGLCGEAGINGKTADFLGFPSDSIAEFSRKRCCRDLKHRSNTGLTQVPLAPQPNTDLTQVWGLFEGGELMTNLLIFSIFLKISMLNLARGTATRTPNTGLTQV